ncbi:restriction endonuclease subunit S [Ruminococcus flavefaciens]|uniref:restriction endonuclease subunit S n=1 Tax=Ruminococcus flavefaciens TaxID=1265 RepID=UPI0026ECE997|nr:restriction endonuclease subunit S [Ruminococcus flavefaciens]
MTFETVRLGDVVLFNPRESIKKGVIAKKIDMSVLQPFTRDVPSYELLEYKGGTKFRNGDTIMARITPCLENGKTAKVNVLGDNEVGFGSTEYIVFRAINGISDEDFVYYLVCSPIVREPAIKSMVGSSGRQRVQTDVLQNLEINLPDLETQRIIGSVLRSIDDRISLNTAINENLEQQAQAYFVDLFIINADPNWRIGTISDLGNVVGGGTPSKKVEEYYTSDGIAWITPKDLSNDKSKFVAHGETDITELGLAKSSATLMPKGTVLFSSRAPIGYIAIADGQVCTNQGFKSIVPFDNVGTAFVYYFLKENLSAIENVASGSTFKEVSGSTMKNFTAIIPDNDTLAEFQRFCSPLFEQQRALEYENRYLSSIRDTLLPKLMNGEIDVSAVKI